MSGVRGEEEAHQPGSLAGMDAVHGHARDRVLLLRDEAPSSVSVPGSLL